MDKKLSIGAVMIEDLIRNLKYYVDIAEKNDGTFQSTTAKHLLIDLCKLIATAANFEEAKDAEDASLSEATRELMKNNKLR